MTAETTVTTRARIQGGREFIVRCIVRSLKNDISITSEMMSPGDCASRSDIAARNSVRTPQDACAMASMRAHSVMPLRSDAHACATP